MASAWRDGLAWLRRHPVAADLTVAVAVSCAALVSLFTTFELLQQDPSWEMPDRGPIVLSLITVTLPLGARRRSPLVVAAVVTAAFVAGRVLVNPGLPGLAAWEGIVTVWAVWVALYTAVAHGPARRTTAVVVGAVVVVLLAEVVREIVFYEGGAFDDLPLNQGFLLAYNVVTIAMPVALGVAVRGLRRRQVELRSQAVELRRQREENARRAVLDERVRIARELHDVVAHHVSVMGVQAGAARRVMPKQPDRAEEALASIESSSRQAVVELHRLLGFLRREGQQDGLAPQPDLSRLPELVAEAGGDALQVRLQIEGEPRPLPSTLELSAYRVIQEALTNTRKHAGATTSTVRVAYRPEELEIEVLDDGGGGATPVNGGHGLIGMRERVGLHGGHLRAGSRPEGGFAVRATFPVGAALP
jgi:signal transduction histidine kinase